MCLRRDERFELCK